MAVQSQADSSQAEPLSGSTWRSSCACSERLFARWSGGRILKFRRCHLWSTGAEQQQMTLRITASWAVMSRVAAPGAGGSLMSMMTPLDRVDQGDWTAQ